MAETPYAERRLYWLYLALENAKEKHAWDKQRGRKNEAQGDAYGGIPRHLQRA